MTLVKRLFQREKGKNITFDDYVKGGWDSFWDDNLTYVGTSARGELQVALGKQALFEMAREPAVDHEPDGIGEELLQCVAFSTKLNIK